MAFRGRKRECSFLEGLHFYTKCPDNYKEAFSLRINTEERMINLINGFSRRGGGGTGKGELVKAEQKELKARLLLSYVKR